MKAYISTLLFFVAFQTYATHLSLTNEKVGNSSEIILNDPCQTVPTGGFEFLGEYNGAYYYQSTIYQKPETAQLIAFGNGGNLAVINDQGENDFIQQNISGMVYIGLNDETTEGVLEWQNGDAVSYTNFDNCSFCNENSDEYDYVMMHDWNGGWSWSSKWNKRSYVIEIPCGSSGTADLSLEMTTSKSTVEEGEQFTITMTISNSGPDDATNIWTQYVNTTYAMTELISEEITDGTVSNVWYNTKDWYISTLPNGASAQLILIYEATVGTPGYYFGIAEVKDVDQDDPDSTPGNYQSGGVEDDDDNIDVVFTDAATLVCGGDISGFTTIGEFGTSKYYVSNENASNALVAQSIAESYGGNLASIHSQAENDFIQQGIFEMSYIGMNDRQNEGTLEWYDGSIIDYTNFDFCSFCNENSYDFNNVMMHQWNGGWSWSNTSNPRKFVMEIPCSTISSGADLALDVSASVTEAFPGDSFSANLTLTNNGPDDATNIEITVWRDEFLEFVSGAPSVGTFEYDYYVNYKWEIPLLQSGESANLLLNYVAEFSPHNTYSAGGIVKELDQTDPIPNNDNASFGVTKINISGCPNTIPGFTTIGQLGNSKYFVSNDVAMNALDAQAIAESHGGNLASINSQSENDFIQQGISEMTYIGMNDRQNEGTLEWYDGSIVDYTNFDFCSFCNENSNQYNNVMMHQWNGAWSWSNTSNPRKFVMEIPCSIIVPLSGSNTNTLASISSKEKISIKNIFPNPVNNDVNVALRSEEDITTELQIFDARGQVVKTEQMEIRKGENTFRINISMLPAGVFFIRIPEISGMEQAQKLIKVVD